MGIRDTQTGYLGTHKAFCYISNRPVGPRLKGGHPGDGSLRDGVQSCEFLLNLNLLFYLLILIK